MRAFDIAEDARRRVLIQTRFMWCFIVIALINWAVFFIGRPMDALHFIAPITSTLSVAISMWQTARVKSTYR